MESDPIFEEILNDPYDITPKWQPVSPTILNENLMSVSDMYFYYCQQLSKLDYEHRKFIHKNHRTYKKLIRMIKEFDKK
jgi:hypothetical protein